MSKRLTNRVLLLGWDAADWQMINPLLEAGQMPNLRRFVEHGVTGNVSTLFPVISPILWNSIATGKLGDKHDILGFIEPNGKGGVRPVSSTSRKSKALWNILSQSGMRSIVLNWYASHPAEKINGYVITERFQRSSGFRPEHYAMDEHALHPPELASTLEPLRVFPGDITPTQVLPFIPDAAKIDQEKDVRLKALCGLLAECATLHNAATHLIEHETWDFMAVYYDAIDHFGHAFMEYHPPQMAHVADREFEIYRHVMNGVYLYHDMMLGRIMELAGDETTIVLLSDHGFLNGELRPQIRYSSDDPSKKEGPGANPVAWHRRYGVVGLHGPGIKRDETVYGATLLDIAPTILTLLGLAIPDDMDGQVLGQCLAEPVALDHIATYEGEHPDDGMFRGDYEEDPYTAQEMLRQLVDLGYIDDPAEGEGKVGIVDRAIADRQHNLAQVYFASGRVAEAEGLLRTLLADAVAIDVDAPNLRSRLAMCLIHLGRFDEALDTLSRLKDRPREFPLAQMLLGQLQYAKGEFVDALQRFTEVERSNPRLPMLHVYLGRTQLRLKNWAMAESAFRRALEIDGDEPDAHDGLGVALRRQGDFEDAVYHHMQALSLEHARPQTHMNLGYALTRSGQIDWAIRAFEIVIDMVPDNPMPHRCLADIYRTTTKDAAMADRHDAIANELRSSQASSLESEE